MMEIDLRRINNKIHNMNNYLTISIEIFNTRITTKKILCKTNN